MMRRTITNGANNRFTSMMMRNEIALRTGSTYVESATLKSVNQKIPPSANDGYLVPISRRVKNIVMNTGICGAAETVIKIIQDGADV